MILYPLSGFLCADREFYLGRLLLRVDKGLENYKAGKMAVGKRVQ